MRRRNVIKDDKSDLSSAARPSLIKLSVVGGRSVRGGGMTDGNFNNENETMSPGADQRIKAE